MKTINDINLTRKQEERLIKGKLKIYGYSYGEQPMKVDRSLFESARILLSVPENNDVSSMGVLQMDESMIKSASMEFFDRFFTLHDVKTISLDDFSNIASPYYRADVKPAELLELCDILESGSTEVNPFDLPISYIPNSTPMTGIVKKPMFIRNNDKYLKKQNVYFSEIALGSPISAITSYSYDHEITHTQIESVKGSVRDFHNSEVLPILIELIAAYETDSTGKKLSFMLRVRLRDILAKMALLYQGSDQYNRLLVDTIYLKSTVQALHLFDIYESSSSEVKRQMVEGIQEIFDGKQVLENFMMKYGVDFKSSSDATLIRKHVMKY